MQKNRIKISYKHDSEDAGVSFSLTLCSIDNVTVELVLTEKEFVMLSARFNRSFYVRCKKEKILLEIDNASTCGQLEEIAIKYYLCDCCDFTDINLYGVKRLLKVVVNAMYRYPKLRSKLCYIGTHSALEKRLIRMKEGELETLRDFNLQYICTEQNAKKLGDMAAKMLASIIRDHESYVATTLFAFGLFDSVLLDKNDYDGYAYIRFVSCVRRDEATGYHPKGCFSPESIVYHEIGHLLDELCGLANREEFTNYYDSLSQEEIKNFLSIYALKSPAEFIAEAFAEYMCNPTPRHIAVKVGEMIDYFYDISCR